MFVLANLIALYRDMHEHGDARNNTPANEMFEGRSLIGSLSFIGDLTRRFEVKTLLDYGCGKAHVYNNAVQLFDGTPVDDVRQYWDIDEVTLYDPGYAPYSQVPEGQFDGVICTDGERNRLIEKLLVLHTETDLWPPAVHRIAIEPDFCPNDVLAQGHGQRVHVKFLSSHG